MKLLTIDIGGTNIKYALYSNEKLSTVREVKTPRDSLESLVKVLKQIVDEAGTINGIGICMPGIIDTENGVAKTGGALGYVEKVEIEKLLERELGYPVAVENDAKAATLAEIRAGSLVDVDNAVVLILGTGVGGAIVIENHILRGFHLLSGEFSFFSADIDDLNNPVMSIGNLCGKNGLSECIEKETGLAGLNGREIFELVSKGNILALKGVEKYCQRLAWFIFNLELITDPEVFAIGGGISEQPILIEMINQELEKLHSAPFRSFLEVPKVIRCHFSAQANLMGAAFYFLDKYENLPV